ncbi:MAG TPA: hypothetical protein VFF54_03870 [Thermodesulfobacteriota bacterium]|nr:hypothetical protein [Thermodesulfobacteriota bacterium]
MKLRLKRIQYSKLNPKQKEIYNFQRLSAILAEFGYMTYRLGDDWQGADFIAQHVDGKTFIKVQLKGRLHLSEKYCGKDLCTAFPNDNYNEWYLFPHDKLLKKFHNKARTKGTKLWKGRSFPKLTKDAKELLKPYLIPNLI